MAGYPNSQGNPNAAIPVYMGSPDFVLSASMGRIAGARLWTAAGVAPNVAIADAPVDICLQGTLYPFLATAQILQISSTSANDAAAGSAARVVQITGLDVDYEEVTENITLDGVTPVLTTTAFLRVNSFHVVEGDQTIPGGALNAGIITLELVGGGSPQGIIAAGIGRSQQAVFTIPLGWSGWVTNMQFSIAGAVASTGAKCALSANRGNQTARNVGQPANVTAAAPFDQTVLPLKGSPPKTDITARVLSVTTDGLEIAGGFYILLLSDAVFPIG